PCTQEAIGSTPIFSTGPREGGDKSSLTYWDRVRTRSRSWRTLKEETQQTVRCTEGGPVTGPCPALFFWAVANNIKGLATSWIRAYGGCLGSQRRRRTR